jgi:2-dehydropantoate 2-reductase
LTGTNPSTMVGDMRVTVVGAGGVGGYFGGRLVRAGANVTFLARGAHLDALTHNGLQVRSVRGDFAVPVQATDDVTSIKPADAVLVAVKSYDNPAVVEMVPSLAGEHGAVVSLQNGVDNEERFSAAVGEDRVVGGAAYIFATISEPGVIEDTGGPAKVVLGVARWHERARRGAGREVPRGGCGRRGVVGHPFGAVVEVRVHLRPGGSHDVGPAAHRRDPVATCLPGAVPRPGG